MRIICAKFSATAGLYGIALFIGFHRLQLQTTINQEQGGLFTSTICGVGDVVLFLQVEGLRLRWPE